MPNRDLIKELSFFARFVEKLERVKTNAKVYRFSLREIVRYFGATDGCIALHDRVSDRARITLRANQKVEWDLNLLADFIRNTKPQVPSNVILAPLRVKRRVVGLIGLKREEPFVKGDGRFLCRLADRVSAELTQREEVRLLTVRARISKEIMRGLRPKDVFYQLLDGLEDLLGYDHSAAIMILDTEKNAFVVQAEKITWGKRKSKVIGLELSTEPAVNGFLVRSDSPLTFSRKDGGRWGTGGSPHYTDVSRILDYNKDSSLPPENSIICSPLRAKGRLVGLLKISSRLRDAFGPDDVEVVQEFLPQAEAAIRASQLSATLHERTIESEKKLGILEIATGVSHDINNALGAVLPLAQSIISDLEESREGPDELLEDMRYIEDNVKLCVRIFGSMLNYAKSMKSEQRVPVDVNKSIRGAVKLLERGLSTSGISVETEIEDGLPAIKANPNRLQQAFFNIISNAREAMPDGGMLRVKAHREGNLLRILFRDSGVGIKREELRRVMQPFFTTKKDGTGLGLSICRSIVWESNGRMRIESHPGKGTTVFIDFPTGAGEREKG
ncbi:GAF domain-containing sensor histidine kinase [bacterium]|nr:GAF domain-containing sensor histidine kinase [bacterium]